MSSLYVQVLFTLKTLHVKIQADLGSVESFFSPVGSVANSAIYDSHFAIIFAVALEHAAMYFVHHAMSSTSFMYGSLK